MSRVAEQARVKEASTVVVEAPAQNHRRRALAWAWATEILAGERAGARGLDAARLSGPTTDMRRWMCQHTAIAVLDTPYRPVAAGNLIVNISVRTIVKT